MVFSSIPPYLDSSNWQQEPSNQNRSNGASTQLNELAPLAQSGPPLQPHMGGCVGLASSIRPGSMAERARLANIPMPEAALKCPRCESSNTKFCYFNNYSLSQPRHFCKTCRRYWTRGGALRSVPVGGGCRRNKRTKSSTSKSPASSDRQTTSSSTSTTVSSHSTGPTANILGLMPQTPSLRFLSPLGQFTDHFTSGDVSLSYNNTGLTPPTVLGPCEANFQTNLLSGIGGGGSLEPWRLQQFPFLGGSCLDSSPVIHGQFHGNIEPLSFMGETSANMRPKISTGIISQLASIKMEENQGLNLSRQLMGLSGNEAWTSGLWADLTSFSSSSTTNPL